jgi:hypothetical protein
MGLRVYLCPVVGDGQSIETAYRPALGRVVRPATMLMPTNPDGSPRFGWALVVGRASDWSAADAVDGTERLFGIDLPDSVDTFAELKAYLQSRTVGEIPAARRQALNTRLTSRGIDTSQITLQTTWWQVLRGICRHLLGGSATGDEVSIP